MSSAYYAAFESEAALAAHDEQVRREQIERDAQIAEKPRAVSDPENLGDYIAAAIREQRS